MSRYLPPVTFILSLLWIPLILFSLPAGAFNLAAGYSPTVALKGDAPVVPAAAGDSIVMNLEEPAAGSTYSGVANVRGWAVAPQGLEKVELYVDDQFFSNIPFGGRRADVGNAYPNYPGSAQSGFAMAFNYSELAAGPHTFTVRAIDTTGGGRDARVTLNVTRFENAFMADPAAVNLDQATLARGGNTITVQNLVADGKRYNIQLDWRPAAQGFSVTAITSAGTSSGLTGTWAGIARSSVYNSTSSFTAHLIQEGSTLRGSVTIPDLDMVNANLTGNVSGDALTFGDIGGRIVFTGIVSADGNTASGPYTNDELDDYGTWQITRTQ